VSSKCYFAGLDCEGSVKHCSTCNVNLCDYHRSRLDLRTMEAIKRGVNGVLSRLRGAA
jgi:hypothetical protein